MTLPGQQQVHINVPNNKVGLIIGKGGKTLQDLEFRTQARIVIPGDEGSDTR